MTSAATGSAHQKPRAPLSTRPTSAHREPETRARLRGVRLHCAAPDGGGSATLSAREPPHDEDRRDEQRGADHAERRPLARVERARGGERDITSEPEERDRDALPRTSLGGIEARAVPLRVTLGDEAPRDDHRGGALDEAVNTET